MKLTTQIVLNKAAKTITIEEGVDGVCAIMVGSDDVLAKFTFKAIGDGVDKYIAVANIAIVDKYIGPFQSRLICNMELALLEFAYKKSIELECEGRIQFVVNNNVLFNYMLLGFKIIPTEDSYDPYAQYLQAKPSYANFRRLHVQYIENKDEAIYTQLLADKKIYDTILFLMPPNGDKSRLSDIEKKKYFQRKDLFSASRNVYLAGEIAKGAVGTSLPFTLTPNITLCLPAERIISLKAQFTVVAQPVVSAAGAEKKEEKAPAAVPQLPEVPQVPAKAEDKPTVAIPPAPTSSPVPLPAVAIPPAPISPPVPLVKPAVVVSEEAVRDEIICTRLIARIMPMFEERFIQLAKRVDELLKPVSGRLEQLDGEVRDIKMSFARFKDQASKESEREEKKKKHYGRGGYDSDEERKRDRLLDAVLPFTGGLPGRGRRK